MEGTEESGSKADASDQDTESTDSSTPGNVPPQQELASSNKQKPSNKKDHPPKPSPWLTTERAMVLLTAALVGTTYLQWQTAQDGIRLSRDVVSIMQLQQRAWISVHPDAVKAATVGEIFEVKAIIKNSGTTAALKVLPKLFLSVVEPTRKTIDGEPVDRLIAVDMGPGEETSKSIKTPWPLFQDYVASIKRGDFSLYVFGTVHYDDIFEKHRTTEFCVSYNPKINLMEFCPDFNRMQ